MKNPFALFLAVVALLGLSRAVSAGDHAKVELLADVSTIQAGRPFKVGFKFTIDPGWHIYWKNPGDAGLATDVKMNLPTGFTAGDLQFPVPKVETIPGDTPITSYVYEDQVLLMMQITPPKDLPAGKITLSGKVSWLVCKTDCIPGSADVSLDLQSAPTAEAANKDLFENWTKQLPIKDDPTDIASTVPAVAITNSSGNATLTVGWKKMPADVQYLPGPMADGFANDVKVASNGNSTKITFGIKGYKGSDPVTGLLIFTNAAGVKTGLEVSIPTGNAK